VARCPGRKAGLQQAAQCPDMPVDHIDRGVRRTPAPQDVDDLTHGDGLTCPYQQQGQQRPLLRTSEVQLRPRPPDPNRSEYREPHRFRCHLMPPLVFHPGVHPTSRRWDAYPKDDRLTAMSWRLPASGEFRARRCRQSSVGSRHPCRPTGTRTGIRTCATGPASGSCAAYRRSPVALILRRVTRHRCEHRFPDREVPRSPRARGALGVLPAQRVEFA
jgi:hypothetical protein